jgi:thiol-disulfide isomerase/thioredoxin
MIQDENYELTNSKELTKLKDGFDTINFSFKDSKGKLVSLSDKQFKNKVVVVQIMGTWCPNCLDETQFFLSYIKDNPTDELAFVALSFEAARSEEKAITRIQNMIDRFKIPYPVLLAQFGSIDTKLAQEKLPMLREIRSYPTTIIISKSKKVNSIYTGFNGPATGQVFEDFKKEFDLKINSLLKNGC